MCGDGIDPGNVETYQKGACLFVTGTCNSHHSFKVNNSENIQKSVNMIFQWSSSPMKGEGHSETPAINILLAAYTLTCGMHVDQVKDLPKF